MRQTDPPAAKEKGVRRENRITATGHLIRPPHTAIVIVHMLPDERIYFAARTADLPVSEILLPGVIVQSEDCRQPALRTRGLEEHRLSWRTVRQLPPQVLDAQALEFHPVHHLGLRDSTRVGHGHAVQQPCPRLLPPRADSSPAEFVAKEREFRGPIPQHLLRPRSVLPEHVLGHDGLGQPLLFRGLCRRFRQHRMKGGRPGAKHQALKKQSSVRVIHNLNLG